MNPHNLGILVMVGMNRKNYKPKVKEVKERYYSKFRVAGGKSGEAGPSDAGPTDVTVQ